MKKLILSGALVLCAATSCTVAKAQWQESAPRVEASTGAPTPSPSSGAGDDYTWNVNGIPAGGINGTGNQVSYTADLKNGRGDVLPELTESTLRTGASLLKTWNWTGMGAQPTTVTPRTLRTATVG